MVFDCFPKIYPLSGQFFLTISFPFDRMATSTTLGLVTITCPVVINVLPLNNGQPSQHGLAQPTIGSLVSQISQTMAAASGINIPISVPGNYWIPTPQLIPPPPPLIPAHQPLHVPSDPLLSTRAPPSPWNFHQ